MGGGLADFWYGKKIILKEYNTPDWKDSTRYIHTTEYEVRDIHHNYDYILCDRCVKKYYYWKGLKLIIPGIIVLITCIIILKNGPYYGNNALEDTVGTGMIISAGYLFIVLFLSIFSILLLSGKIETQRSAVAISFFSSKFKKVGYNQFYTPWDYVEFLKKVEAFKKTKNLIF